jgi:hypothetical protein
VVIIMLSSISFSVHSFFFKTHNRRRRSYTQLYEYTCAKEKSKSC